VELPSVEDALHARAFLSGWAVQTPVLRSDDLDRIVGGPVAAKAEGLQVTGSFKVRCALNRLHTLPRQLLDRGLVTVSSGNAAIGFAYAARALDARRRWSCQSGR
jgi:threonine dehydratase